MKSIDTVRMDRWMGGWWMDGWVNGWVGRWMNDGWMISSACEAEGGTAQEERKLMWTSGYMGRK